MSVNSGSPFIFWQTSRRSNILVTILPTYWLLFYPHTGYYFTHSTASLYKPYSLCHLTIFFFKMFSKIETLIVSDFNSNYAYQKIVKTTNEILKYVKLSATLIHLLARREFYFHGHYNYNNVIFYY